MTSTIETLAPPRGATGMARCGVLALWQAASMLLAADAAAQSSACDQLKATLNERIESTGVRGHSLDVLPGNAPVPSDARVIGTCDGTAFKVVYRRFGASKPPLTPSDTAPAVPKAAAPAPAPVTAPAPPRPPAPKPALEAKPAPPAASRPAAPATAKRAEPPEKAPPVTLPDAPPPFDIDAAVAQLRQIGLDFEAPADMTLGDTVAVRLLPGTETALAAMQRALGAAGGPGRLRVLTAQLSGAGFRVTALGARDLGAASAAHPQWEWRVEPTQPGAQALRAIWAAEFVVDGAPVLREVRTFDQPVEVKLALWRRVAGWIAAYGLWLLALAVPVAAGLLWAWYSNHSAYDKAGLPRGPRIRL